jgi:hypothetical protein
MRWLAAFADAMPHRTLFKQPATLGDPKTAAWNEWSLILFAQWLRGQRSAATEDLLSAS